ncbi:MAG TPA: PKD domain-containing protein [Tepidisphaeraceae bacterium]|jgi:hypothetical protein|nr:PKD domain-containing protein [Tepidisphaeraceae bacterium]
MHRLSVVSCAQTEAGCYKPVARRKIQILSLLAGFWFLASGFLLPSSARAASGWFDDSFRRPIEVIWDADNAGGSELCYIQIDTEGHHNADGSDIRVATDEGRQLPAKVLRVGPGDRVSLIFSLVKGLKRYYVYFGNPMPPANKPGMDDVKITSGLLLDMHVWTGTPVDNFQQVETAWGKAGPLIGRTMIDSPFYGINPFGPQEQTISKVTGSLFAPLDGEYTFAIFADDRGALYLDGNKVLFATLGPADATFQAKTRLKRGRHDFLFYHVNTGGDGRFTVTWMRPDMHVFEAIPRGSFGIYARGIPGALEELHKTLVADFTTEYAGECFYADGYSHRYKFAAREPKVTARANYEWDFGDGQTATGAAVEHVYLADGVYPVKMTVRVGTNNDTMTNKLQVERDWPHIEKPPLDEPPVQSMIVGKYDLEKMPADWLARDVWLQERAGQTAWMMSAAMRMAAMPKHANAAQAFAALEGASKAAVAKNETDAAVKLWEAVPAASDLQPNAAQAFGNLLLWQTGDSAKAVAALQPYANGGDAVLRREYADALVLNQDVAAGKKILQAFPINEQPGRHAAKSGALARTIEYYIETKDWETGEQQWDNWQQQFPADFLEGYSVMLKTRLMELKGAPKAAAAVAEAFAKAVPMSSYAPQLLFRAAKLLEPTDAVRSSALMKLLKDRYPEDPLSQ